MIDQIDKVLLGVLGAIATLILAAAATFAGIIFKGLKAEITALVNGHAETKKEQHDQLEKVLSNVERVADATRANTAQLAIVLDRQGRFESELEAVRRELREAEQRWEKKLDHRVDALHDRVDEIEKKGAE